MRAYVDSDSLRYTVVSNHRVRMLAPYLKQRIGDTRKHMNKSENNERHSFAIAIPAPCNQSGLKFRIVGIEDGHISDRFFSVLYRSMRPATKDAA